ncbi:hypothetical protein Psal006b_03059 [Piscirickettsia salmonis]|uniref:LexA-binding, inner membrane-associated hydrolase n=2 Tax=Piscirickettsia salmonis TaxID=1238 RepID=A0AAC8VF19_PISSA|nr:metal-dependent hydrolase [Piscirickettsia salmonis]AKP74723.1 hypothetical protein PSLF89_3233 [Piscirickettsia salmonis LF-89 = ATCC VR-1361]ALB21353.1 LexA-binding, inner membrane-associated hydrolase [Piscirickettsia salmonis]ALY01592.1 hypothetical protein AWE47_00830 [Piscirickettsia salmonis]AMA41104.1 hypothetical protein AWJ11_00825 [Piscirickettsia salmonis]AOS36294.1 hypothetical protein AVM72_13820 [Piscirickettsia salmonis]
MANFHTHITVAAVASVSVAIILAGSGIVEPGFAVLLCALGTLGGILPDIDSDHSTSIKIIFHCFAIGLAFLVTFALLSHYSILICLVVWFGVYLAVLFIVQPIFKNFTVHRGVIHSIPMAVFVGCLSSSFCFYFWKYGARESWLVGIFVTFGFMVHLILDEMYSVDLSNAYIKRSFGTACKVYSQQFMLYFAILYGLLVASFFVVPRYIVLKNEIFTLKNYHKIETRLLPNLTQAKSV